MSSNLYDLNSYNYHLPEAQIAQEPASKRDQSRLLLVDCQAGTLSDGKFPSIVELVGPNDLLVVNDTKVFPARLLGRKESGGRAELLLLSYPQLAEIGLGASSTSGSWKLVSVKGLVKSSKRPKVGSRLVFGDDLEAVVDELLDGGAVRATLRWCGVLDDVLTRCGNIPLPPYIQRKSGEKSDDRIRYQTVYARENGAIAAPTAGLHFTDDVLARVRAKGCGIASVTLHVGYATFAPVRVNDIREHEIHSEYVTVPEATVEAISRVREAGGLVWAVGTTSARALEFAADGKGGVRPVAGDCQLYIYPGYRYKVVDNLITNFHLPKSSLLFMVSALAGKELMLGAYAKALELGYRFYSYGDAMVLVNHERS